MIYKNSVRRSYILEYITKLKVTMFENYEKEQKVLEKFLSVSVKSSDGVFDEFKKIEGAKMYGTEPLKRFLYIPGTRDDRVLLVAHADTVWDKNWVPEQNDIPQKLAFCDGEYFNGCDISKCGLGADDRAGCAMLYLLKNSGHSILILDGEEHGQLGSHYLKDNYPEIFEEINNHQYALQFDRRNKKDFKCYNIHVTDDFKKHIKKETGFKDAGTKSKTDIVVLCEKICGANLSIGYYDEHTAFERLKFKEWLRTYKIVENMLEQKQEKFKSTRTIEVNYEM